MFLINWIRILITASWSFAKRQLERHSPGFGVFSKRQQKRLFKRKILLDLKNGQFGLPGTNSRQSIPEDFRISSLFLAPQVQMMPLQIQVTKIVLKKFGASYVPRRLRMLLEKMDAFQAIDKFLQSLRLDFHDLLGSSEARLHLDRILDILIEIDELCKMTGISDAAAYKALAARDFVKAETVVDRLHKARRIHDEIHAQRTIDFPEYQVFLNKKVIPAIKRWKRLDDATLNALHHTVIAWQKLQEELDTRRNNIKKIIVAIKVFPFPNAKLEATFYTMVALADDLLHAIVSAEEPASAMEEFDELYDDFVAMYGVLEGEQNRREEEKQPETDLDDCSRLLGLAEEGRFDLKTITLAYRRQIQKYHPDRNSDPDAERMTQMINNAYYKLKDSLEDPTNRGEVFYA